MTREEFRKLAEALRSNGFVSAHDALIEHDTAQREALARVEAERDRAIDERREADREADTAQAQLAEAVGMLEKVTRTTGWDHRDGPLISQVHDFLIPHREASFMKAKGARHAQAEQQEVCWQCGGTGEADTGGVMPWGAPALEVCPCQRENQGAQAGEVGE